MENRRRRWYAVGHETPGNRPAAGKAAPTGHPAVKGGQDLVGSGTGPQRLGEFGVSLERDIPKGADCEDCGRNPLLAARRNSRSPKNAN